MIEAAPFAYAALALLALAGLLATLVRAHIIRTARARAAAHRALPPAWP